MQSQEDIIKAQELFHKMVGACGPKCFRKLFTDAICQHSIYEFYPVVAYAELSAALALSLKAKERDYAFDFYDYLYQSFSLTPKHLVRLPVKTVARIMEKKEEEVEKMLRELDFIVKEGHVATHPDIRRRRPEPVHFPHRVKIVRETA